jgi:hypothetical protein
MILGRKRPRVLPLGSALAAQATERSTSSLCSFGSKAAYLSFLALLTLPRQLLGDEPASDELDRFVTGESKRQRVSTAR